VTYGFPFVDVASGGSVRGMIEGLESVLGMVPSDVKIIPGHGPLSTPVDVRNFINMLKETRAVVADAAQRGKTLEEMKKDRLLAKYEDLGKGFIKTDAWIELLHAELTQKKASQYQSHGHRAEAPVARE
jgi:cyclase